MIILNRGIIVNIKCIENYEFIEEKDENVSLYFSTSKNNLNFKINSEEGMRNISNLKNWFHVEKVGYLNQTHSDKIYKFDGNTYDGDSIITDQKNVAIGVFTADCVPILIYDKTSGVVAAVHSGWKGTVLRIVEKTIKVMKDDCGCDEKNISAVIGPHNKVCCYEFGMELIEDFKKVDIYRNEDIYVNGKLDLQKCIMKQLKNAGIKNIKPLNICTYCTKEYQLHSYRRDKEKAGRMFSFITIKAS